MWDGCRRSEPGGAGTGVITPAGYFYCATYSRDDLRLIPSSLTGVATVKSCSGIIDTVESTAAPRPVSHLGYARFSASGTELGYNPCGLNTPIEESTWGKIKASYR